MKKMIKVKIGVIVGAIVLVAVGIICIAILPDAISEKKKETKLQMIEEKLVDASRLETADYICTMVESTYDSKKLFGKEIPLTETGYVVTYNGSVSAGIDLSKAKAKFINDTTIEISLPNVEVYEPQFDNSSLKKFDEKNSIFNPLEIEDVNNAEIKAKEDIKKRAIECGIEERAKQNAEKTVSELFSEMSENVKISWEE